MQDMGGGFTLHNHTPVFSGHVTLLGHFVLLQGLDAYLIAGHITLGRDSADLICLLWFGYIWPRTCRAKQRPTFTGSYSV